MGTALCPEPCLYTSACLLQELIGEVTFPEEPMRKGEVTPAAWSLRPFRGRGKAELLSRTGATGNLFLGLTDAFSF
jgi:hypothetical protein